jgi:hypothetical protein
MAKFIFVTGGVLSSLGKGITSASIATLLQHPGPPLHPRHGLWGCGGAQPRL